MNGNEMDPKRQAQVRTNVAFIALMMTNYSPTELVETMRRASGRRLDMYDYTRETGPEDTDWWNRKGE